ncbi:MAG: DUF433 domain-containing protein [Candidatus Zixiibacteriota bacterium]
MKTSVTIRDTGISIVSVLRSISQGYSYDQILKANPGLIMSDIMAAADLARQVIEAFQDDHEQVEIHAEIRFAFTRGEFISLNQLRQKYPRAYVSWTEREDQNLTDMFQKGVKMADMTRQLGRQPGAIQVRLRRLNLIQ